MGHTKSRLYWAACGDSFIGIAHINLKHIVLLIGFEFQPAFEEALDVKRVLGIRVRQVFVIRMLRNVVFVRQKRSYAAQLQNAFSPIHHSQLVNGHQLLSQLLKVGRARGFPSPALARVKRVDGFPAERFGQLLERRFLFAAKENYTVTVDADCVRAVLVQRFELALRLQHQTRGDFSASDGRHQLFKVGNLPDVGALVNQAAHMHGQASAVHVVRLFAQEVEKLGVDHADKEVERAVRIAHDEEQRRLAVAQRIQLQLIIRRQFPKLRNIKRRKPRRTGNQNTFCSLARNDLSRTFSSKNS